MKTLKTLAFVCLSALLFVGCSADSEGSYNDGTKGLLLRADKYEIYDDGKDKVTFYVTLDGERLTDGYVIYDKNDNPLSGDTFSSTQMGEYEFWAEYGAAQTDGYTYVSVLAVPPTAPENAPVDSNPSATNFKRNVMLLQFTGTGCGYCPGVVTGIHQARELADWENRDNFLVAAAHIGSYAGNDPAKLEEGKIIDDVYAVTGYPDLVVDLKKGTRNVYGNKEYIKSQVDKAMKRVDTKGGIAVNAAYHPDKQYVVLRAWVKAAATDSFRVGAWLLQDKIKATQTLASDVNKDDRINYNEHNNCIRAFRSQKSKNSEDFTGLDLGTISAGETKSMEFNFPVKMKKWKLKDETEAAENLRLLVFISTKESDGSWCVNNVIEAPVNGEVSFQYE